MPVGKVILLFWVCSTIIGLAVSLVIYTGYLELNKSALGWWLSILGIIAIPLLSAVPFLQCVRAIEEDRISRLAALGSRARELYAMAIASTETLPAAPNSVANFEVLVHTTNIIDFIRKSNRFPFDPRASIALVGIYAAQILVFVYKLLH